MGRPAASHHSDIVQGRSWLDAARNCNGTYTPAQTPRHLGELPTGTEHTPGAATWDDQQLVDCRRGHRTAGYGRWPATPTEPTRLSNAQPMTGFLPSSPELPGITWDGQQLVILDEPVTKYGRWPATLMARTRPQRVPRPSPVQPEYREGVTWDGGQLVIVVTPRLGQHGQALHAGPQLQRDIQPPNGGKCRRASPAGVEYNPGGLQLGTGSS